MPAKRLPMRKIREVLRLSWGLGLTSRQVAASLGLARSTVAEYVRRAEEAGLSWPLPPDCDDFILERRLFPPAPLIASADRPLPDWTEVARELGRKGMTLFLLWHEYKQAHPLGYQYSRYCDLYREWAGRRSIWMRQDHKAGERIFVDYAGGTVGVVDRETGDVRQAQVFVAVLGASSYTYAEATWTQAIGDWVGSHVRAFEYFEGVAALVVSDNLRTGVSRACRYEPGINSTYAEMLAHYGSAALPTRVGRPQDKAKVESAVQVTQRWILARLRHRTFFSLGELNAAIRELLEDLNTRRFRKLPGTRRSQYEALDRPALLPLPAERYELAEWRKVRTNLDYHVEVEGHYYSVPYQLCGVELEARVTARVVECFHKGRRVASHVRSSERGRHTTAPEHMPKSHQAYLEWTPERIVRWTGEAGPATRTLVERLIASKPHPQQGFRAALGIMRLGKIYGPERLEAASERALRFGALSYRSLASILKCGLDRAKDSAAESKSIAHPNIRGAAYFKEKPSC
jgi:transposase